MLTYYEREGVSLLVSRFFGVLLSHDFSTHVFEFGVKLLLLGFQACQALFRLRDLRLLNGKDAL
jgi:hypothetical protein